MDVENRSTTRISSDDFFLRRRFTYTLPHHDDDHYEDGEQHKDAADRDGHHGVRWRAANCEQRIFGRRPTPPRGDEILIRWPLALANGQSYKLEAGVATQQHALEVPIDESHVAVAAVAAARDLI
jgi:hypothetical protein